MSAKTRLKKSLFPRRKSPLALTGKTADEMSQWIEAAHRGDYPLQPVYVEDDQGNRKQLAVGYGFERLVSAEIMADDQVEVQEWTEQVFLVCSESYRQVMQKGLDGRLQRATDKLLALTPPPARGRRQFQEEEELRKAAKAILQAHEVEGLLTYTFERQEKRQSKYNGFHRLKGAPLSLNPLFVKRDDQVVGLIHLLSMAVRFLTLIEFIVRRELKHNQEKLTGLIENNPRKGIDNPTTERLLKLFDNVTLTIVHLPDQTIRHVTPLSSLQIRILELLGLSASIYTRLAEN